MSNFQYSNSEKEAKFGKKRQEEFKKFGVKILPNLTSNLKKMAEFGKKRHKIFQFWRQNPAKFDAKSFAELGLIQKKIFIRVAGVPELSGRHDWCQILEKISNNYVYLLWLNQGKDPWKRYFVT